MVDTCGGFGNWETSDYVLPYPVGAAYEVDQANCSGFGHSGFWKYGYDFLMPVGALVTAARAGTVVHSIGDVENGDFSRTNLVTVRHDDGTVLLYSHFTRNGNLVAVGDRVQAGDPIGLSGNTGNTGNVPHLHFSLHACERLPDLPGGRQDPCPTLPLNFRNTKANPQGLEARRTYRARPFD